VGERAFRDAFPTPLVCFRRVDKGLFRAANPSRLVLRRRASRAVATLAIVSRAPEVSGSKVSDIGSRHAATVTLTEFSEKVNIFPRFEFPDRASLAEALTRASA
jgi:hypothetical protein